MSFQIKGKYAQANIMINDIDETTYSQIQNFLNHPAFKGTYIAIMPDCHAGQGAVIGFTCKGMNYHIPNIVGVDIGCGMLTTVFDSAFLQKTPLEKVDRIIRDAVPLGFKIHGSIQDDHSHSDWLRCSCNRVGMSYDRAVNSYGTLGGGNHFIELGVVDAEPDKVYLTIHTGSRNYGKTVAEFYQSEARKLGEQFFLEGQFKGLEFLPKNSPQGENYFKDLQYAQMYAFLNRSAVANAIWNALGISPIEPQMESVHNFIDETGMIRKGATPAHMHQDVIIPFNMRDGIALCKGKGNSAFNESAPHGAGRILSRSKAKENLSLDHYKQEMKDAGVFSTSISRDTLDEAPGAYKNMETILDAIAPTVHVVKMIRPIYSLKAGGE